MTCGIQFCVEGQRAVALQKVRAKRNPFIPPERPTRYRDSLASKARSAAPVGAAMSLRSVIRRRPLIASAFRVLGLQNSCDRTKMPANCCLHLQMKNLAFTIDYADILHNS